MDDIEFRKLGVDVRDVRAVVTADDAMGATILTDGAAVILEHSAARAAAVVSFLRSRGVPVYDYADDIPDFGMEAVSVEASGADTVPQNHRFMRLLPDQLSPDDEHAELSTVLMAAPGIRELEIIGPHPKGGYRVSFDLAPGGIDAFIAHLERHDWRAVL
jgi:hypothetical protein